MTRYITAVYDVLISQLKYACCSLLLLALFVISGSAQTRVTDGVTPLGLSPGSPAGSFPLGDFDHINLFNGNLNFRLPMTQSAGRGSVSAPLMLPIEQHWQVIEELNVHGEISRRPDPQWWQEIKPVYGPGLVMVRYWKDKNSYLSCTNFGHPGSYGKALAHITFTAPDATEFDLRAPGTGGIPAVYGQCAQQYGNSRGQVFVTSDGTAATFTSDSEIRDEVYADSITEDLVSGYLKTRDGTVYRVNGGYISWMRDRNGNLISFTYDSQHRLSKVTDSLNREMNLTYDVNDTQPYGLCDWITYKGFGEATRTIRISHKTLANVLRQGFTLKNYGGLFPELDPAYANVEFNPTKVSAVWLPDGQRSYKFFYDSYGELARVELPTSGAMEYDWAGWMVGGTQSGAGAGDGHQVYRRVVEKRLYSNATTLESKTTFSRPDSTTESLDYVVVDQLDASGTLLGRSKHYFFGNANSSLINDIYSGWKEGREYKTESLASNGTTVLQEVITTWQQREAVSWWYNPTGDDAPPNDPRIASIKTTLLDTNQVSEKTFSYDDSVPFNNRSDVYEYDWGQGSRGSLLRRSHTDFLTSSSYTAYDTGAHIRNLPSGEWISSDSAGNIKQSRKVYEYDNYTSDSLHAPLVFRSSISGHDSLFTSSYVTRGNSTKVTSYSNAQNSTGAISVASQYDIAGNPVKVIDGRGYATNLSYSDCFGAPNGDARSNSAPSQLGGLVSYAFVTSATNALGHVSYSQFDYATGRAVDSEDINGTVSSAFYDDPLDRQTQIVTANNNPTLRSQKTIDYNDEDRVVTVSGDLRTMNDNLLKNETSYDGLGRTIESRTYENGAVVLVSMQYNALGKVWKVTNPYRSGDAAAWTTTFFDSLGRVTRVKTSDYAEVLTSYSGNTVTVADQAGKQRKSVTDALGRLTSLIEAPNDTTNFNFQTSYVYDVLGEIRTVTQGSQKRYFYYDSLARLVRARIPEQNINANLNLSSDSLTDNNNQWSLSFVYDNNGNLLTKTDARGASTSYSYDALNRVTQRSYSAGTGAATPNVTYTYDAAGVSNSKGRLTSVSSSVSACNYASYDALGRITASQQVTDGQSYSMSYAFDLVGNMTSQVYPTGRIVTNGFDSSGRLVQISGQIPNGTTKTYANAFGYTAHGAVERLRLGNGRWEHAIFNQRLQPTEMGLGASAANSSVLKLNYEYGTTENNGNVLKQVITVPTIGTVTGFTATLHYQYDQLNRLTRAQEVNGLSTGWQPSGALWQQMFNYDRFGNRAVDAANTTSTMIGPNPQISTSTNRIVPRTSPLEYYEYDEAGSLKKGQGGDTFAYDAENMLVQYEGGATQIGGVDYFYDGTGKRVKKATSSSKTVFVYNIAGQLVAEYSTSTPENNGTTYFSNDSLGTPRVTTSAAGTVLARHDYLPFGGEVFAGTGYRSTSQKYGESTISPADKCRQKFTGQERDIETNLDFFNARYYAYVMGRFTTADPLLSSGTPENPQSWARYTYTLNNPLKYIDPSGLYIFDKGVSEDEQLLFNNELEAARQNLAVIGQKYGTSSKEYEKAKRALDVYGENGVDNGVTIVAKDGDGGGRTYVDGVPDKKTSDNPLRQRIHVEFDHDAFKSAGFSTLIGHEGSHAADGSGWVGSGFDNRANPAAYQTEVDAFTVQSLLAEAAYPNSKVYVSLPGYQEPGKNPSLPENVALWDTGWAEADKATLRQANIDKILERPQKAGGDYGLTPASKSLAYKKGTKY